MFPLIKIFRWEEEDKEDFIELRVIDDWLYPSRQKQKVETIGRFRNPPAVDEMPDDSKKKEQIF